MTRHLVRERVLKPLMPSTEGGGSPDSGAIRAARSNIKQHMKYTNWLAGTRNWLAGPRLSYADLAAAGDAVGARLSRRDRLDRLSIGQGLVHAAEIAAVLPARCSATGCAACRRSRITRIWISDDARPGPSPIRRASGISSTARRGKPASIWSPSPRPTPFPLAPARLGAVRRRRAARLDGLARRDRRPPRRPAALCGRKCARSSCSRMNYGPDAQPARHSRPTGIAARSRSMPGTATITTSSRAG